MGQRQGSSQSRGPQGSLNPDADVLHNEAFSFTWPAITQWGGVNITCQNIALQRSHLLQTLGFGPSAGD